MSQNLEESPVSDNKMDISEATTSQDSFPGYSPDAEECTGGYSHTTVDNDKTNVTDCYDSNTTHAATNTTLFSTSTGQNENDVLNKYLDNRNSDVSANAKCGHRVSSSGLTPVSSHPLMMMSPTGSESDVSEFSNVNTNQQTVRNYYHFPDVIPVSEQPPLRLANPFPVREKATAEIAITTSITTAGSIVTNTSTSRSTTSTLDVINNLDSANNVKKSALLQDASPDFFSSESEQDISQFQASVTPSYQSVALVQSQSNSQLYQHTLQHKSISPKIHQRRKIPLSADLLADDISSLEETISNHSVDELQQNLVSLSPSSSILDDNGFNVDIDEDFLDVPGTPKNSGRNSAPLPQYSAQDEARDIRNWQKITLPDGKTREIDMKVIEPYKRVLSHGGYLQSCGHNAIVVFSACHLPDRSRADYHYVMNNLFLYVVTFLKPRKWWNVASTRATVQINQHVVFRNQLL